MCMHRYLSKPQFSHVHDKTNKELLPRDEMFWRFPYGDGRKLIDNIIIQSALHMLHVTLSYVT